MNKIKEWFQWNILGNIEQLTIPIVSMDYVINHNGSYFGNNWIEDKYVFYWIGDFQTGYQVKVKAIDVGRYKYQLLERRYINEVKEIM